MAKKTSLKETADQIMKIKGNVRGTIFQGHLAYIRSKKGEEGVKAVEKKLKELGYPLKFEDIKPFEWYPDALSSLVVIVAKEIFNWREREVFEMGKSAVKISLVVKLLWKYFISFKRTFKETSKFWRRHVDFGELIPQELNEKERYIILRVKWHGFHPLICVWLAGFLYGGATYVFKNKEISIEETKCGFKGDPFHEYLIRWREKKNKV